MSSNLPSLLILRCWQYLLLQRWQSPRVVRPTRAAHSCRTPWRDPSRACGVSGLKRPRRHVVYRTPSETPPATYPTYRAHHRGHTITCSCANNIFSLFLLCPFHDFFSVNFPFPNYLQFFYLYLPISISYILYIIYTLSIYSIKEAKFLSIHYFILYIYSYTLSL